MRTVPRLRPLWLIVILLAVLVPASALLAAPRQALYSAKIVQTDTNCGITQVYGVVLDPNGNHMPGTNIRLWWGGGPTIRARAGDYVRNETGASGWDFTLNTHPVANTWYVAVDDGGDIVLSDQLAVQTDGHCNSGGVNAVKVEIRHTPDGGGSSDSGGGDESPPPSDPAPAASNTEAAPPLTAGASCVWYTETAGGNGGFSVCDDGNARFYSAFATYGLQNVGYPISQRFKRDGFITQAFQKAVFQWRPDGNYVAFVNVFDELHNRGLDQRLLETRQTPNQLPDGWDGDATFEQVKQRRQALLNQRPALYSAYFSVSDPLLFFGLPTSEITDMGNHYAIRLQRGVLQEWKENVPWANIGQVTVANGGDIAKEMDHFSASILTPESSPPAGASAGSSSPPPTQPPAAPQPTQPPAPAQPSAATPGGFGYGIQAHMIHLDKAQVYGWTQGLGFNWIKQQIEWKVWEGSQGNIDWGEMDAIIDGARANGITMLFSTVGAPSWAREAGYDSSVAGPPQDPNTFAAFNAAVAARYCGKGLGAIEVWNEQNLHYEWGNKPLNPADYMALLRPSYTAIKQACPSMIVVSGALTPAGNVGNLAIDDFTYLEGMLQNGLLNYADTIGAHPSGYNVPPNLDYTQACAYIQQKGASFMGPCDSPHHSWSFKSTVDGYYDLVQRYGGGKLIWATEFGWAAGGAYHPSYAYANDNSYDEQAAWTVEAFQYMRSSGKVGAAFLWNLNFRIVADGTEKAQWGILRNDTSPLPAYGALAGMPK